MLKPSVNSALGMMVWGCAATAVAWDQSISQLPFSQAEFQRFSEELGAGLHYKALAPAEPLGLLGFDLGLEASVSDLTAGDLFRRANRQGDVWDTLYLTRFHAHKGLPFGLDVGLSYALTPQGDLTVWGGELRYALWSGNVLWPALAVRGTYAKLGGTAALDLDTSSLELTASKGFLMLTPYAGIGYVWTQASPQAQAAAALQAVDSAQLKTYIGANLNLFPLNLAAELENTGGVNTASLKLGMRF